MNRAVHPCAVATFGWLVALFTPSAQAATVDVTGHVELRCCASGLPGVPPLAPGDTLRVTPTGFLDAPAQSTGAQIDLRAFVLENNGRVRAVSSTESFGLNLSSLANSNQGSIEAGYLTLGRLLNNGQLIAGAATLPDGQLGSFQGDGMVIGASSFLENSGTGIIDSYGVVDLGGTLENAGRFVTRGNLRPAPATTTILGASPGAQSGLLLNAGQVDLGQNTALINSGRVDQRAGTMTSNSGAAIRNEVAGQFAVAGGTLDIGGVLSTSGAPATFDNRGQVTIGAAGTVHVRANATFLQGQGGFEGNVTNAGSFVVDGLFQGGRFQNEQLLQINGRMRNVVAENTGNVQMSSGSLVDGAEFHLAGAGSVVLDADSTFVGNLFVREAGRVEVGGSMDLGQAYFAKDTLDGVPTNTVVVRAGGDLNVASGQGVVVDRGTGVLNEGVLHVLPTARLAMAGTLTNRHQLQIDAAGELDLRPQEGQGLLVNAAGAELTVNGTIRGAAPSQFPEERGANIQNAGTFRIASGGAVGPATHGPIGDFFHVDGRLILETGAVLNAKRVQMFGGTLEGNGLINGDVFIAGSGPVDPGVSCATPVAGVACFTPGFSPGHTEFGDALTMGANSILELELLLDANGMLAWDSVTAASMNFLDGSLIRLLVDPRLVAIPELMLLTCTSGPCDTEPAMIEVQGVQGLQLQFSDAGLRVSLNRTAVPSPFAACFLLGGLALFGLRKRTHAQRAAS